VQSRRSRWNKKVLKRLRHKNESQFPGQECNDKPISRSRWNVTLCARRLETLHRLDSHLFARTLITYANYPLQIPPFAGDGGRPFRRFRMRAAFVRDEGHVVHLKLNRSEQRTKTEYRAEERECGLDLLILMVVSLCETGTRLTFRRP